MWKTVSNLAIYFARQVLAAFPHDLATPLGIVQSNPQVNGLSLNTAQEKFLAFLLRAPTLSYPGGLYLLQAFRGRSGKEMIARFVVVVVPCEGREGR